ncbi:MAG TPA: hypothetical protein IGS40_06895 [Trichormus sp. M33_DOE_039]|nr:hypothetical protein [Trichormus sp. M33_DOE_039]
MELLIVNHKKSPQSGVSQLGELVIRVHLPINSSTSHPQLQDEFLNIGNYCLLHIKKAPSQVLAN